MVNDKVRLENEGQNNGLLLKVLDGADDLIKAIIGIILITTLVLISNGIGLW